MKFNNGKIQSLRNDFSIFHPSPIQIKNIIELGNLLSKKLGLDPIVITNVIIIVAIQSQKNDQKFLIEIGKDIPQSKIVESMKDYNQVAKMIVDLLDEKNPDAVSKINEIVEEGLLYYIEHYAGRPNTPLV